MGVLESRVVVAVSPEAALDLALAPPSDERGDRLEAPARALPAGA